MMAKKNSDSISADVFVELMRISVDHLQAMALGCRCVLVDFLLNGEQAFRIGPEKRWFDRIVSLQKYDSVVCCMPLKSDPDTVTAATATECCTMVMRKLYLQLFGDAPPFVRNPNLSNQDVVRSAIRYCNENESKLLPRADAIAINGNWSEWLKITAMADIELNRLTVDEAGAEPEADVKWANASENCPAGFPYGPITATKQMLGVAFDCDWRTVEEKLGSSRWGRQNHKRSYSVWFSNQREFDLVSARLAETS